MSDNNPFETPVSKNEFNGYWIPKHNAKVMKEGIEYNSAPFLPNANGEIKAEPIYNASTGYVLPATRLIPAQFAKEKKGYESNIVIGRNFAEFASTKLKENEKGVFYNFKDETGEIHTASYFFPEQTENPNAVIQLANENLKPGMDLSNTSIAIASSNPEEYLSCYIAACKCGAKLSVSPEIAEDFKQNLSVILDNDLRSKEEKDVSIPSLGNTLFNADKKATELCKVYAGNQNEQTASQKKNTSYDDDMEMCF